MTLSFQTRIAITDNMTALRCRFLVQLIKLCGAEPVLVPIYLENDETSEEHFQKVEEMLQSCHGLVLPGNKCDVPPYIYGVDYVHPETQKRLHNDIKFLRFETEMRMAAYAIKNQWPIIGICGGMHVFNVLLGGSLIQHLPTHLQVKKGNIAHYDPLLADLSEETLIDFEKDFLQHIETGIPKNIFGQTHRMAVEEGSYLGDLYKAYNPEIDFENIMELSIHHQGCFEDNLAPDTYPTAMSPDGVVEAFQIKDYKKFCLITQFHWEANVGGIAKSAIQTLIDSALKDAS